VKASDVECKYIYISPPNIAVYEDRLRKRGTETEDRLQAKVAQATAEMAGATVNGPNRRCVRCSDRNDCFVREM
jgi:guanylate kinase